MGFSGYYTTDTSPPSIIEFPLGERPGSSPVGRNAGAIARQHDDLFYETDEGVFWDYPRTRRRIWELTFRLYTEEQLQFFEQLHLDADGQANPFWFIPDVDETPMQEYLVRKLDLDFIPPGVAVPIVKDGYIVGFFDYVLRLREESAAAYILA